MAIIEQEPAYDSYNPFGLNDRTILVTGASSGIGRATAIECAKLGASVIISGRNCEKLKETLSLLPGDNHKLILCDLSNPENIDELVYDIQSIDGFVSNAGYTKRKPVQFIDPNDFLGLLQVNLMAPVILLKKLLKQKKLSKGSSVVFTSSLAGIGRTSVGNGMYTAAKGGLSAFVRSAAKELASKGIRVNAVCPAMVDTGFMDNESRTEAEVQADLKKYPLGRYATCQEIALAIVYLLSNASSFTTGTNLVIDGGLTL